MNLELLVFCDALKSGFAAVTYLRMLGDEVVQISFLASKSHVTPAKQVLTSFSSGSSDGSQTVTLFG